ncbi:dihydrodipicolinate synthase family protein [Thermoproteota archaeon]
MVNNQPIVFGPEHMHSIIPPLDTPLNEDGSLDTEALKRKINHVLGDDYLEDRAQEPLVHGVFINGKTGEFPWTGEQVQKQMVDATADLCRGIIPVLAGTTGRNLDETIELSRYADKKADALVIAPFYFNPLNAMVLSDVRKIANEVESPIYIYTNAELPGLNPDLIEHLSSIKAEEHINPTMFGLMILNIKNIYGAKVSSGDDDLFKQYEMSVKSKRHATVFKGDETTAAREHKGRIILTKDIVPSLACIHPKLVRRLYDAICDGKEKEALKFQAEINAIGSIIYCDYKKIVPGLKYAQSLMGLCGPKFVEPGKELTDEDKKSIEHCVETDIAPEYVIN